MNFSIIRQLVAELNEAPVRGQMVLKELAKVAQFKTNPPYSLFDNLVSPLWEFLIFGPIILFLARVNRGGWPKWIEKLALRFKLIEV